MRKVKGVMNTTEEYKLKELEEIVTSSEVRNENNKGLSLFLRIQGHKREIRWPQLDNPVTILAGTKIRGFYKPYEKDNSPYTEMRAFELYDKDENVIFRNISEVGYRWIKESEHAA